MTPYTKQIVELHKIHKAIENCGCNKDDEQGGGTDSGNLLMSLIPNDAPKPDLFLYRRGPVEPIDVTNYKIDDLLNLYIEEELQDEMYIICLYESSTLSAPIISNINFSLNDGINLSAYSVTSHITTNDIDYNNKTYYYYYLLET